MLKNASTIFSLSTKNMALRGWSHYELYSYCFSFLVICSLIRILFLFNSHSTWQNKKNEIGKVPCHYDSLVLSQPQALRLARNSPAARSICGGYNKTYAIAWPPPLAAAPRPRRAPSLAAPPLATMAASLGTPASVLPSAAPRPRRAPPSAWAPLLCAP